MTTEEIKEELIKKEKIYTMSQIKFTYNIIHLKGINISEKQITDIFYNRENNLYKEYKYIIKYFNLLDYILKNIDKTLTIEIILDINKILNSKIDLLNKTNKIFKEYNKKTIVSLENIIDLYIKILECTNNDTLGLIIIIKECLKNNITPVIIFSYNKYFYLRGLKKYKENPIYLIESIKYSQNIYLKLCTMYKPIKLTK